MLIDRINQKVKSFLNTDGVGNYSPTDFNLFLHDAIQNRNEEYFFEVNRMQTRANKGLIHSDLENVPDRIREKIAYYIVPDISLDGGAGTYSLPTDLRYIDEIESDGNELEFCKSQREFKLLQSMATNDFPIYTITGSSVKIAPATLPPPTVSYIRKAKFPKWTYNIIQGQEVFNPSAPDFQDADIHPSEEDEMVRRILLAFGVNLKEPQVQQFGQTEEQQEFRQENAS